MFACMKRRAWIEELLAERGLRKKDLATALDVPHPRITEIIRGDRAVHTDELPAFARILALSEREAVSRLTGRNAPLTSGHVVRVANYVEAGVWTDNHELSDEDQLTITVPPVSLPSDRIYGLRVRGQSMDLVYPAGAVLFCIPTGDIPPDRGLESGDHVVVERRAIDDGVEATIKELRRHDDGSWWLWPRSSQPEHQQPIRLDDTSHEHYGGGAPDIQITGLVVGDLRFRQL